MSKRVWIGVVVVSFSWMAILSVVVATQRATDNRIEFQVAADKRQCVRGNVVRAWIRWDTRLNKGSPVLRATTADRLFPILDCSATQQQGKNVSLPDAVQLAFIRTVVNEPIINP